MNNKPLGRKAYGSIGHLPGSRMGPADHSCPDGYLKICCEKPRDKFDRIFVQEKLDGSCVSVVLIGGKAIALGRAGYLAETSPYPQHHLFAEWVAQEASRFQSILNEGERVVGEWLAQAHGTRYELQHEPFVAFDIMRESARLPLGEFTERIDGRFVTPALIACEPISIEAGMDALETYGFHGATDPAEGLVWRVERHKTDKPATVDFLAKFVRPDKVDGKYLPEISGADSVWNWKPEMKVSA